MGSFFRDKETADAVAKGVAQLLYRSLQEREDAMRELLNVIKPGSGNKIYGPKKDEKE